MPIIVTGDSTIMHSKNMSKVRKRFFPNFFVLYIFSQMMSLSDGALLISQLNTRDVYLSSGDRFSIISLLKCPVKRHFFTYRLDWNVTNPNPPFDVCFLFYSRFMFSLEVTILLW
jgi:hypothetical protein